MSFVGLSYNFFVGELFVLVNISATVTDNLLGQNQKAEEKEKKNRYIISLFFLNNPNWLSQANESYSLIQESSPIQCFWKAVYEVVYRC